MQVHKIVAFSWLLTTSLFAQRIEPDRVKTVSGDLTIQPILHSTVVFTWNNKVVYHDPYGGSNAFAGLPAPDLILITDIHSDHYNLETLNTLDLTRATLIVPPAVAEKLPEPLLAKAVVITNGQHTTHAGISVKAIPMYNLPETPDSRHPKGRGNGYVIRFADKQVYLSGDTEDIPEMRALMNIDIAFVCMNQPFTMDIKQAASAVLEFKPGIVYPFHYRGQSGLTDVEGFKKLVMDANPAIEVRLRNWYPIN
ncbi:MAG: MBL fold metallo-hydrolase [Flammeovirgaceae bacterium]|nr:MAG: MBL fold metallo-hydrolase [Flammeovirgaceae bacterium]